MNFIENIDAYLEGSLSAEEMTAFDKELQSNSELMKEVELQQRLQEGIFAAGLRNQLKEMAQSQQAESEPSKGRVISLRRAAPLAVAASVALLLGIFLWNNQPSTSPSEAFASVYYQDPGTPITMGQATDLAFQQAMVLYKEGKFEEASHAFDPLCDLSVDVASCYYQAQSALQIKDYNQAESLFNAVIHHSGSQEYIEKGQWYLAYMKFERGDEDYKDMLQSIAADKGHRFHLEASQVLDMI